jgi:hypothetical protein
VRPDDADYGDNQCCDYRCGLHRPENDAVVLLFRIFQFNVADKQLVAGGSFSIHQAEWQEAGGLIILVIQSILFNAPCNGSLLRHDNRSNHRGR